MAKHFLCCQITVCSKFALELEYMFQPTLKVSQETRPEVYISYSGISLTVRQSVNQVGHPNQSGLPQGTLSYPQANQVTPKLPFVTSKLP